jgi:nucleotide-binding universal stress UspA family protein
MIDIRTILVATDFSDASEAAAIYAFRLARTLGVRVYLIYVVPESDVQVMVALRAHLQSHITPETLISAYYTDAEKRLAELVDTANAKDLLQERLIVTGQPAEEIVSWAAAESVQIIIVGTHGRRGLERLLIGSVADRVLRRASCAVLVVPPPT